MPYRQEIYSQTHKSTLDMLDKAQATALRAVTGTSRFTNLETLQVATNIEPLEIERIGARLKIMNKSICQPREPNKGMK